MKRKRFKLNRPMLCNECPYMTGAIIEEIEKKYHEEWIGQLKGFISKSNPRGKEFAFHRSLWQALKDEGKNIICEKELSNGSFCDLYIIENPPEVYEIKAELNKNLIGQAVSQLLDYKEAIGECRLFFAIPRSEKINLKKWMIDFLNRNEIELVLID